MITGEFIDAYEVDSESYAIRKAVFIEELAADPVFLIDPVDAYAYHLVVKEGQEAIGVGRIVLDEDRTYIGRIAVKKSHRGQSIGDLVVKMLIDRAFRLGLEPVYVYARLSAIGFYESIGFKVVSDPYVKEGVEVVDMSIVSKDLIRGCSK